MSIDLCDHKYADTLAMVYVVVTRPMQLMPTGRVQTRAFAVLSCNPAAPCDGIDCNPLLSSGVSCPIKVGSGGFCLQLNSMPLLYLFSKYFVHQTMLLNNRKTLELIGDNIEGVH